MNTLILLNREESRLNLNTTQLNQTQIALIEFIKATLKNDFNGIEGMNVPDCMDLINLAAVQGLYFLIPDIIENFCGENSLDEDRINLYKENLFKAVIQQIVKIGQLRDILSAFGEAGVPVIVIKGPAIGRLYKKPEYRSMNDIDLLVEASGIEFAKRLIEECGYKEIKSYENHPMHYAFEKKDSISIELHSSLINTCLFGERNVTEWYKHIWESREKALYEDFSFLVMSAEDELVNQLIHFAAHFMLVGNRLKNLYDIALIISSNTSGIDWKYITDMLQRMGFYEFGSLLLSVCKNFFGVTVPDEIANTCLTDSEEFMNDFLNSFVPQQAKGEAKGWMAMIGRTPFLTRSPVFLPAIWVYEVISQFKICGFSLKLVTRNSWINFRINSKKISTMNKFKLKKTV